MTRAILNVEALLVDATPNDSPPQYEIVLTINGHEFYRFPTEDWYKIQYKGYDIAWTVAEHLETNGSNKMKGSK